MRRSHLHARGLVSIAAACFLGPVNAGAQFTTAGGAPIDTTVGTGARIRVSVASAFRQSPFSSRVERLRGTIRTISRDTIYLDLPNVVGAVAIPRASIRRVEVSLGRPRGTAALQGGAIGAVILGFRMWVAHQDPDSRRFDHAWQAVAVGSALGFAAGAWLGSRLPRERWRVARLRG